MAESVKPLPKSPMLPANISDDGKLLIKALCDHILASNNRINALIKQVNDHEKRIASLEP